MSLIDIIKVNKRVKLFYQYLVDLLTEKGLYDSSLDLQILNLAGQIIQYEKLINCLVNEGATIVNNGRDGQVTKKNPILNDLNNTSDGLRKNLKELGLSLDSKIGAVGDNDPLSQLMNKMNNVEEDEEE